MSKGDSSVRSADAATPQGGSSNRVQTDLPKDSQKSPPSLQEFLSNQDDATKARYAKTLSALGDEWARAEGDDFRYAESLVYFGLAERKVEKIMQGEHVRGSRTWFRKVQI